MSAFQKPTQDETLWSFMASVNHLASGCNCVADAHTHSTNIKCYHTAKKQDKHSLPQHFQCDNKLTEIIQTGLKYQYIRDKLH